VIDDVLSQLAGASPRKLLEDLARIGVALAKNDRARPEVECFLASGQLVRGRIVSVAEDRQGAVALIAIGGNPRSPSVTFVRVDQIAAVTVVDASLLVKAPVVDAPIPSKLELSRQLAARGDALANALGKRVELALGGASELDDDGRRAIGAALPLVADVLAAIASDDMGKEALRKLETVELGAASSGDVGTYDDGRRLVIRAPKLLTEQYTAATLRKAIEKLL
jgi:hypothetical protein